MRILKTIVTSILLIMPVVLSTGHIDGKDSDLQTLAVETAHDVYDKKHDQNRRRLVFGTYPVVSI